MAKDYRTTLCNQKIKAYNSPPCLSNLIYKKCFLSEIYFFLYSLCDNAIRPDPRKSFWNCWVFRWYFCGIFLVVVCIWNIWLTLFKSKALIWLELIYWILCTYVKKSWINFVREPLKSIVVTCCVWSGSIFDNIINSLLKFFICFVLVESSFHFFFLKFLKALHFVTMRHHENRFHNLFFILSHIFQP